MHILIPVDSHVRPRSVLLLYLRCPPSLPVSADLFYVTSHVCHQVCVTFPEEVGKPIDDHSEAQREVLKRFCGDRKPVIYDEKLQNEPVLYFGGRVSR